MPGDTKQPLPKRLLIKSPTLSPGSQHQDFSIVVTEDSFEDRLPAFKSCAEFRGVFRSHSKALFRCNAGLGQQGRYVRVQDRSASADGHQLGLCEVQVFARPGMYVCRLVCCSYRSYRKLSRFILPLFVRIQRTDLGVRSNNQPDVDGRPVRTNQTRSYRLQQHARRPC